MPDGDVDAKVGEGLDRGEGTREFGGNGYEFDWRGRLEVVGAVAIGQVGQAVDRILEDGGFVDAVPRGIEEWSFAMCAKRL